jgi:hypothetical protein
MHILEQRRNATEALQIVTYHDRYKNKKVQIFTDIDISITPSSYKTKHLSEHSESFRAERPDLNSRQRSVIILAIAPLHPARQPTGPPTGTEGRLPRVRATGVSG